MKNIGGRGVLLLTTHPMRMRILSERSESKDLSSHPIRESVLRSIATKDLSSQPKKHFCPLYLDLAILPRSLRALFTLLHKSARQISQFQPFAHSFPKIPGVGVFFPFRSNPRPDALPIPRAQGIVSWVLLLSTFNFQLSTALQRCSTHCSSTGHRSRNTGHTK
jgi:hypothetical protein